MKDHEDESDDDVGLSRTGRSLQQTDPGTGDRLHDGREHSPDRQALLDIELTAAQLREDNLPYKLQNG